jgi:hypothetical protein
LTCAALAGFPNRFPLRVQRMAAAVTDKAFTINVDADDVRAGRWVSIGAKHSVGPPAVLVWGDSHAMAALPAIDALLKQKGLTGRAAMHSVTAPVLGWFRVSPFGLSENAPAFNEAVLQSLRNERVTTVILAANWSEYTSRRDPAFDRALVTTVQQIRATGATPWILLSAPEHTFDVPRVAARAALAGVDLTPWLARVADSPPFDGLDPRTIEAIQRAGGHIVDQKPAFLDASRERYVVTASDRVLYRDHHHLSTWGARHILMPLLDETIAPPPQSVSARMPKR